MALSVATSASNTMCIWKGWESFFFFPPPHDFPASYCLLFDASLMTTSSGWLGLIKVDSRKRKEVRGTFLLSRPLLLCR